MVNDKQSWAALRPLKIGLLLAAVSGVVFWPGAVWAQGVVETVEVATTSGGAVAGWLEKIISGGLTVLAQIALSVVGASFIVERFFKLKRSAILTDGLVEEAKTLWEKGQIEELKNMDERDDSILAKIIVYMSTYREQSPADISMAAGDIAGRELEIHSQKLYPIAVIASIEPLLGLLGTVLGMIEAFDTVALAGSLGDPSQLAGGISKALLTTAIGLSIAVPFLIIYHIFKSRLSIYTVELEREVTGLINLWFNTNPDQKNESTQKEG